MKNFLLPTIFLTILLLSSNIFAGDYAKLNFIGFSRDGKYLAFEEYGTQDGSGFPYSNIFFIETAKNSYAAAPIRIRLDESKTESAARLKAKTAAAAQLKRLNIIAGNTGELVAARLLTDLTTTEEPLKRAAGQPQKINFTDYRASNYFLDEFNLTLTPSEIKDKRCGSYADQPIYKFALVLKNEKSDTEKVLQRDVDLPASRECPIDYSIQNIYVYQNKIAVIINVFTVGFEGSDMRFLSVTGIYK